MATRQFKRKLFIGSSQVNGSELAEKVKGAILRECSDWLVCDIWFDGKAFALNRSTLNSLITASRKYDYGIFIATKDDPLRQREKKVLVPRDNVVFEMGLFMGSMGSKRSFFLVEEGSTLPSDFAGISVPTFQKNDDKSLAAAINRMLKELRSSRGSYNLKPIPSATLALGYFDNFLKPFASKVKDSNVIVKVLLPKRLSDFEYKNEFYDFIDFYAEQHISEDVSLYQPNTRPVIKKLKSKDVYWDIPTTLFALKKLFDRIAPITDVVGNDKERDAWIAEELHNFMGAVAVLIEKDQLFRPKVEFLWISSSNGIMVETKMV